MSSMYAMPPRATGSIGPQTPEVHDTLSEVPASTRSRAGVKARHKGHARTKEEEVLDVAAEYFLAHGYQGASINAMARSSGISKESIYRYFNSKKHLFEAVIDRELSDYKTQLEHLDVRLKVMEIRKALLTVAETILGIITDERTVAMRRLIFEEAAHSPGVGQHYWDVGPAQAYRNLENVFADHLDGAKFDPQILSQYFMALLAHKPMLERACGVSGPLTPEQIRNRSEAVVDDFVEAFLRS